jgi:hypothetical protein
MMERIDDGDVGVDFNGLAIEDGGRVLPAADGVDGGLEEEWIAGEYLERLDRAVGGDDGAELHCGLPMKLYTQVRIDRLDASDKTRRIEVARLEAACFNVPQVFIVWRRWRG